MTVNYLKKATRTAEADSDDIRDRVQALLREIETGGDEVAIRLAKEFDQWDGDIVVSAEHIAKASDLVPERLKNDIRFAHDNVRRFAEAQRETVGECQTEIVPGLIAGQRQIPMQAAGCYVKGGRYSHIASDAGVKHVMACSPPKPGVGIPPAILYALDLCGADSVLNLGGVQGVAAMAFGLFGMPSADILVGPGNQFVAEAKRLLFGRVGIDMFAGPTNSLVIADSSADAEIVAWDLVGQAEHGYNSPVWLVTTDKPLADTVMARVPEIIETLPKVNADNATAAWRDYAEVIVCDDREEMASVSDDYAPEHLHVQAQDLDWWLARLSCYGSLFLGEETTVAFGDKSSGPNHVLPTSGAARYTGGLSVHKFIKTVTWQRATRDATHSIAQSTARISRLEGMEGHARTADVRLEKYFPSESFKLGLDD